MRVLTTAGPVDRPPVTLRAVRGIWYDGRSVAPGDILTVPPNDAIHLIASGKAVRHQADAPPAAAPVPDPVAPLVAQTREPVRRMRR